MKIADAHCDTLTRFPFNPFLTEEAHWNLNKFKNTGGILQYFAVFTPPELAGDSALKFAFNSIGAFYSKNMNYVNLLLSPDNWKENEVNILLSLEGASPIINDLNNLHAFYNLGVRAMGLTWNHRNFAADGVDSDYGLTSFGIEMINEMERLKMIIDVSHLNTAGFDDVLKHTIKPFIASHSNAFSIMPHKRNLHDEQIKEIINRRGFVGINFYSGFLGTEESTLKAQFLKHIEHFLQLGAENILGMGADFDGIDKSPFKDVTDYDEVIGMLENDLKLSDELINKIMWKNLTDFTLKNI